MTFAQYNTQTNPQRLEHGQVELTKEDVSIYGTITIAQKKMTKVNLNLYNLNYVIVEGSKVLRTIDENGNPDKMSVFSLDLENN